MRKMLLAVGALLLLFIGTTTAQEAASVVWKQAKEKNGAKGLNTLRVTGDQIYLAQDFEDMHVSWSGKFSCTSDGMVTGVFTEMKYKNKAVTLEFEDNRSFSFHAVRQDDWLIVNDFKLDKVDDGMRKSFEGKYENAQTVASSPGP